MNDIDVNARILWDYEQVNHKLISCDAIFALGSMDIRVAERAAELWHSGVAGQVVASGGVGRLSNKSEGLTEAEKFKDILISKKIPAGKIILEVNSSNTAENLKNSIMQLTSLGMDLKRVAIVTLPFAEKRTYATMSKQFPNIEARVSSPLLSFDNYPNDIISKDELINLLVGEAQRIKLYPERGYTVEMPMDQTITDAMNFLIAREYTSQLIN